MTRGCLKVPSPGSLRGISLFKEKRNMSSVPDCDEVDLCTEILSND